MPIYLYGCTKGHRSELIRPIGTELAECATCGQTCGRVYGYSVAVTQPEADTRGMFRRFTEASAEMDHAATRQEANTGQPSATPNLWKQAQRHAQAVMAAGEAPPLRRNW